MRIDKNYILKFLISLLLVLSIAAPALGSTKEKTDLLHKIIISLEFNNKSFPTDSTVIIPSGKVSQPVAVRTDRNGIIEHVGYTLVDRVFWNKHIDSRIIDFIERYPLQLELNLNNFTPLQRMDIDGVKVIGGDHRKFSRINPETPLTISSFDWKSIVCEWDIDGKNFVFDIPADRELILGAAGPELENLFISSISDMERPQWEDTTSLLETWGYDLNSQIGLKDGIYLIPGELYLSDLIRSDITVNSFSAAKKIYINPKNPSQSVTNIMLTGLTEMPLTLKLTVDKYGNKKETVKTDLQDFLNLCREERCQLYFGIKKIENDILSGTLFAVNKQLAYNHVLSVEFPLDILNGEENPIIGKVYLYVPLQNIYGEFFFKDISAH